MLARKDLHDNPALSANHDGSPSSPDLHELLNCEHLDTHTLLLLFLLPESNRDDIDTETMHAVEVLSEVQTRLFTNTALEAFDRDKLAGVIECISDIRFGGH